MQLGGSARATDRDKRARKGARMQVASAQNGSVLEELRQQLAQISDGKLSVDAIDPSAHIFDYGYVDSLSAVTFLAHIEERFGVQIEDVDLVEKYFCLEAIAHHIEQNL
jgi:acyl carrier protein